MGGVKRAVMVAALQNAAALAHYQGTDMTNENDVIEAGQLLRKIGAVLDHPSLYMGGPSRQSMMKAAALLPIIERIRIQAVEAERARVVAILAEAKDIIDAVQFRSLAVRIERGDHLAGDGGTAPNAPPQE